MRHAALRLALAMAAVSAGCGFFRGADPRALWVEPFAPFRVVGNVHYVGSRGLSAFLVTTPEGAILIDGGVRDMAPLVAANVETLGTRMADVKFLLNSHAHFDHAGGLAELKRLSGATAVISRGDAAGLRAGNADVPPLAVDREIDDGATVQLGDVVLTAHVTPGHTRGCTTWTMQTTDAGRPVHIVFYCSTSVVAPLVGNERYPEIAADYERSFAALRGLKADVFLGPHPEFFDMEGKRARMTGGSANPFIDPMEMRRFVARSEREFRAELERQRAAATR